jgi:hypothetical protein
MAISRGIVLSAEKAEGRNIDESRREMARSAARTGGWERALRLAGAATAVRERIGAPLAPSEKVRLDADLDPARRGLPGAAATTAWMRGWATSLDEAVEYGLRSS